jgi:hypothetical protein
MGWETRTLEGESRELCLQDGIWSCQIASIATVINRYGGGRPTETAIIQRSREHAGDYRTPVQERPGFRALPMASEKPAQPSRIGTQDINLAPTLDAYKIIATPTEHPTFKQLQEALNHATQQNPVILEEPFHIVVCDGVWSGKNKDRSYVICDPERGLQKAQLVKASTPKLKYQGREFQIEVMWTTKPDKRPETRVKII